MTLRRKTTLRTRTTQFTSNGCVKNHKFCAFPHYCGVYLCMVHTELQTNTPLAHAHCEVEQAKRSDSINICDGCSVSWVKGRLGKHAARGQELAPQWDRITNKWLKVNCKPYVQKNHTMYAYETWRQDFKHYYSRQKTEINIQFHAPPALSHDEGHIAEKGGYLQPIWTRWK